MKKKEEFPQQQLDAVESSSASEVETLADPNLPAGTVLANERKSQNMTVEEIAAALNLSVATIRALEADQSDGLPELTYVRGYIRSYARLIGLNPESVVANYSSDFAGSQRRSFDDIPHSLSEEDFQVSMRRSSWLKWTVLLGVIALVIYWWSPSFLQQKTGGSANTPLLVTDPPVTAVPQNIVPTPQSNPLDEATAADDLVEAQVAGESPSAVASTDDQDVQITPVTENVLVLSFAATCWVDARDSEGTRLAYQSIVAGENLTLSSDLAMTVFLGNAEGVTATLNGEDFSLTDYRQGVYAKFTIEPTVVE